jgi:outer membrane protein assembly factor BamB
MLAARAREGRARLPALAVGLGALCALVLVRRASYAPERRSAGAYPAWQSAAVAGHGAVHGPRSGRLAWSFATGGRITGAPVVAADGTIYATSHDGHLYALDARGGLRWRRSLEAAAFGGPLLDDKGNVYAGSDAARLWSFDATGAIRFVVSTPAAIETAPALDAATGNVLCAAGRSLLSLRSADGALVWRFEAWRKIFTSAVSDQRGVYFGAQDRRIYALSHEGRQRWVFETAGDVDASPALAAGGTLYAGSDDGYLYALAADGGLRWRYRLGSYLRASPAVAGDPPAHVIAVAHGQRSAMVKLDAGDGRLLARVSLGLSDSSERAGRAAPIVAAAGVVYLGLPDHRVLAVGRSAEPLWTHVTGGAIHANPVLGPDGALYIGSDDGTLYAFRD